MKTNAHYSRVVQWVRSLFLLRHTKAVKVNSTDRDDDRQLNELGIAQAQKLAAKIDIVDFDTVLSSPLIRVHQTLKIAIGGDYEVQSLPELTCATGDGNPIDVMFNELGYSPMTKYLEHPLGEHLKVWGETALESVLKWLPDERRQQTVMVGGHAVLQNALGLAFCQVLEGFGNCEETKAYILNTPLGEGEVFKISPRVNKIAFRHIKLD